MWRHDDVISKSLYLLCNLLLIGAVGGLFVSCGPLYHYFSVEKRVKCVNKVDFGENVPSIYMVYPVTEKGEALKKDSLIYSSFAISMAKNFEQYRGLEEGSVGVYSIPSDDYCGLSEGKDIDYLRKLVESGGSKIQIFLSDIKFYDHYISDYKLSKTENGYARYGVKVAVPFSICMEIFDAERDTLLLRRNQKDTLIFGTALLGAYKEDALASHLNYSKDKIASGYGRYMATRITDYWISKDLMLLNYGNLEDWNKGYILATKEYDWDGAIKLFMPYTNNQDRKKASHAAYNIASCFYAMGKKEISMEWILYAEKLYNFSDLEELKHKIIVTK